MPVRTRFAPSPTGFLHVGSARTALYAWLYARHHGGKFILRIEDTDRERSTPEAVQAILDAMQWLNLDYEEGPFYQTQRFDRYKEVAEQLLKEGKAYRCYCSKARLDALRAEQIAQKRKPRYDGRCRNAATSSAPHVIRFRNPDEEEVVFTDLIHGHMVFKISELDDLILVRSDGTPTYNFTVVVDDRDMAITHVIRGDDHLNNTPRQINILKALGATLPTYAHVPMILGSDGQKLSKRHGAVSVMEYRNEGYLPEALLNYLVRLGWAHGDQEIFSRQEMVKYFEIAKVNKAPAAFNSEKLQWLNQHYIKTSDTRMTSAELGWQLQRLGVPHATTPSLEEVLVAQIERAKTLKEMAEKSRFFYEAPASVSEALSPATAFALQAFCEKLATLSPWQDDSIHTLLTEVATQSNLKLGQLAQPIRLALTGGTVSPPINTTIRVLGKKETLARIQKAVEG